MFQGRNFLLILALSTVVATAKEPKIRVSLGHFSKIKVEAFRVKVNHISSKNGFYSFTVRCQKKSHSRIIINGYDTKLSSLSIDSPGSLLNINKKTYREQIMVYAQGNTCLLVNILPLEQYISGVINNEMPSSWPVEALKAQAIASRSYAVAKIKERAHPFFDLRNSTKDQVYGGAHTESFRSNLAVRATRGKILRFKKETLKAYYHANCGGKTNTPQEVWGEEKQHAYTSVTCPHHQNPLSYWSYRVSLQRAEGVFRQALGGKNFAKIAAIDWDLSKPLKTKRMIATDTNGKRHAIPAHRFRLALGANRLKSTNFIVSRYPNHLEFQGKGHGHGVGMCQYGANHMARLGTSHKDILKHYYPLAKIDSLY